MCYFITLVVQGADEASIAPVLTQHERRAKPISNRSVASILQPGELQFLTTVGYCNFLDKPEVPLVEIRDLLVQK